MTQISSYPSLTALGNDEVQDILLDPVFVEEKVDGSQISFGFLGGELFIKTKTRLLDLAAPDKQFSAGVTALKLVQNDLHPNWIYRGEYLARPRHNVLAYDRAPKNHVCIFDISREDGTFLTYDEKKAEADRIGFEVVPLVYSGMVTSIEQFTEFLERISLLGGSKIEGVVVKNYTRQNKYGRMMFAKFVSEGFKEVSGSNRTKEKATKGDLYSIIGTKYKTVARWHKAVQHLRDDGKLLDSPKDIGNIFKEVQADVLKECGEDIKQELFDHAWRIITGIFTNGIAEWYKEELLKKQFEDAPKTELQASETITTETQETTIDEQQSTS